MSKIKFEARVDVEVWQGTPVMLVDLPERIAPGYYRITLKPVKPSKKRAK